jgi:hypothetical protein
VQGIEVTRREVLFEGLTEREILALPRVDVAALVLTGEPLVFRIGSATILGEFRLVDDGLLIELAQIENGGEGVLIALCALARRFAALNGLSSVEWVVHAIHCANPNLKLRRVLTARGFVVEDIPGIGEAYHLVDHVQGDPTK